MAESYHEDVLEHLQELERNLNSAINKVVELQRNGDKYNDAAKTALIDAIKAADQAIHSSRGGNVGGYLGNSREVV